MSGYFDDQGEYCVSGGYWEAYGEYADGSVIQKDFPYTAKNYREECEEEFEIECWLVDRDVECLYYSVAFIERI